MDQYNVINIGSGAFMDCSKLTNFKWLTLDYDFPLNGIYSISGSWTLKFSNENFEILGGNGQSYSKGIYFINENTVYRIGISGNKVDTQVEFSLNGDKLKWGGLVYTRQ